MTPSPTQPPLKIAFISLARTTFDIPFAQEMADQLRSALVAAGFTLTGPATLVTDLPAAQEAALSLAEEPVDLLLVFQASFADSTMVSVLAETIQAPLFLWATPEDQVGGRLRLNSLCGINLGVHTLRLKGIPYQYVYARPGDPQALDQVRTAAQAGYAYRRLKQARMGVVGEHPAGFEACHLDETELARRFGVTTIHLDLHTVFERARAVDPALTHAVRANLDQRLPNLASLEQKPLTGTLNVYTALQQIAREENLDGLAVRCWPEFFTELGCAACGALSMLTDELLPCSCEADANGTVTQMILQWLNGAQAFGSDLVAMDFEKDTATLWHCGLAPLSMANPDSNPRGTIHSNRKLPLLMEFTLKPGLVTLARLTQSGGQLRLVLGRAEMLAAPAAFTGTTGTLRFDHPARQVLDTIIYEGLEHHVSITYGDTIPALTILAKLLNLPTLAL
ncbi:MAG TPA: L-fucose/L-arabinose isomerase family protein [Anaerolineaceae bacterium]